MIGHAAASRASRDVAAAAQLACLLEASAPKPGNVSPGRRFEDASYEDFLASAVAIGEPLAGAAARGLGETIWLSIEETARWTRSNTNLGIVLLLAPLARAAILGSDPGDDPAQPPESARVNPLSRPVSGPDPRTGRHRGQTPEGLRASLRTVLERTTLDDARHAYRAIRLAAPGGLGRTDAQDVAGEPTATLLDVMKLAAHRDGVAREYASTFETTFRTGAPALEAARNDGLAWDDAIVETFLTLLAASPDTHIARRAGEEAAAGVSRLARAAMDAGGVRSDAGRGAIEAMDRRLRESGNLNNPGTTADLTAAAIYVVLLARGWTQPTG